MSRSVRAKLQSLRVAVNSYDMGHFG